MKNVRDKIVFYDGDCGFCNQSIQFILKFQKDESLHFAAIQSVFTEQFFTKKGWELPDLSTVYFYENELLYSKSDAGICLAHYLKFPFSLLQYFWVIPQYLRDKVYDFIAQRRHRLRKGYCLIPSKDQKKQFVS